MLALATSVGAGYDAYCSHLTARYLTYLQREDVLIFHHGQGYIARPVDGCQAKHKDRHAVSYIKPFRTETWLNDTLTAHSAGMVVKLPGNEISGSVITGNYQELPW